MTKLEKMLKYVSEHNDFYKNRIKEYGIKDPLDITQWPVLTRKELQENRYNMFSDKFRNAYYWKQLFHKTSSGTSGIPITSYWDFPGFYSSAKALWKKRKQYYSILPTDKTVRFSTSPLLLSGETGFESNSPSSNILNIVLSYTENEINQFKKIIEIVSEFQPKWLYIRPSILKKLLYYYKNFERNAPCSIAYIESYGEILEESLKNEVSIFFNTPVANLYGSEEANAIAYECPHHKMHILSDSLFVECIPQNASCNQSYGEVIITTLSNYAMPLIRYNQGDVALFRDLNTACECGISEKYISFIDGRTNDIIKLNDSCYISSQFFLEIMGSVNNEFNFIILYYKWVYVLHENKLICQILIDKKYNHWHNSVIRNIESKILNSIKLENNINIEFMRLEKVPESFSHKHKIFEVIRN